MDKVLCGLIYSDYLLLSHYCTGVLSSNPPFILYCFAGSGGNECPAVGSWWKLTYHGNRDRKREVWKRPVFIRPMNLV